jgi:hypothetical protein
LSTKVYWIVVNSVKIGAVEVIYCLGTYMDFCLCFPTVLSDLGKIQCAKSVHTGEQLQVSCKSLHRRPYFSYGCKWNNIYARTMKWYEILKVKISLVRSVLYEICNLVHNLVQLLKSDEQSHSLLHCINCKGDYCSCFIGIYCITDYWM